MTDFDKFCEKADAAIEIAGVSLGYGHAPVLDDISLSARAGEFLAIVGPNGCGKSTALKLMAGLLKPATGSVRIGGEDIAALSRSALARRLALLAQDNHAPPGMTVLDLVGMGRFAHETWLRRRTPEDVGHIDRALNVMDVGDLGRRRLGELSGGQLQRCRMAMTLAQDAGILLLDEPTNHLDLKYQYALLDTARGQARIGRCVIAVLHDLTQACLYADRIAVIDHGRIRAIGPPQEVLTVDMIADVYGVRTVAVPFGKSVIHLPKDAMR
jgi:iron complex transport system ATP-binding protein